MCVPTDDVSAAFNASAFFSNVTKRSLFSSGRARRERELCVVPLEILVEFFPYNRMTCLSIIYLSTNECVPPRLAARVAGHDVHDVCLRSINAVAVRLCMRQPPLSPSPIPAEPLHVEPVPPPVPLGRFGSCAVSETV